jgi:hypothetical protein
VTGGSSTALKSVVGSGGALPNGRLRRPLLKQQLDAMVMLVGRQNFANAPMLKRILRIK